jgi:hypothetical protein
MQFWIEKTYVKSRLDRQQGDFAFGSVTSNNTDRATLAQIIDTDIRQRLRSTTTKPKHFGRHIYFKLTPT